MSEAAIHRKLDLITRLLVRLLNYIGKEKDELMALQPEVQDLVDKVTQNTSLVGSMVTASQGMAKQISDLQAQIASQQPGQPIDAEDLQAIKDQVAAIAQTNASMPSAAAANTPQANDPQVPPPPADAGAAPTQ